jgi:glutamyl-tRNA synthetase
MVRTRFAPSPTGYLHIGGVRTALYNWLFARSSRSGGQFILRIDDTDAKRNVQEALQPILDGFKWLGLDWDEGAEKGGPCGPYYQSQKKARYQEAVKQLLDKGLAYPDAGAVRLRMPDEGECRFFDHIRGETTFPWAGEADHVIQRDNGSATYNLASVVDDFDMKITHVIRAEEHLSNTPRQIFIAQGLGYDLPQYAHLPVVAEPGSKRKLSKRDLANPLINPDFRKVHDHGVAIAKAIGLDLPPETFNPVMVDFYRQVGYLPDAILNYLLLLGWSLDDRTEHFTRQQMIDHFSLERVNKAAASFDARKLFAFQERWMQGVSLDEKVRRGLLYLHKAGLVPDPAPPQAVDLLRRVLEQAAHRIVVFGDVLDYAYFFAPDDKVARDEKAFDKYLRKPGQADLLRGLRDVLAATEPFDPPTLEAAVRCYAEARTARLGDVAQAARVATTGKGTGFGTFETLALLGKQRCLARFDRTLTEL